MNRKTIVILLVAAIGLAPLFGAELSATNQPAEILTPKPGPKPHINGPKIYGAHPGNPFLYRIPCTGERPIQFSAKHLPRGLKLDSTTGIITGITPKRGEYKIIFTAKNPRGKSEREFKLVSGDTLALTPPMGFNDWYSYYNRVTATQMRAAADIIIASGMADVGYQFVNVDDCWMGGRDAAGNLSGNTNFPDMKALADYIHAKGLKAGLYTSPGPLTCAGYTGAFGHEAQDAKQFADWGFDFLKYDWCSYGHIASGGSATDKNIPHYGKGAPNLEAYQFPYRKMGALLLEQKRDILYNLCQYGMGDVWKWGTQVDAQSWRTGGDLGFELNRIFDVALRNAKLGAHNGPGGWNDPDYIQIGWVGAANGMGQPTPCKMSATEQYAFMSLWCLLPAPLFFSGDVTHLDEQTLSILCNPEVIDVNQDPLGKSARVINLTTNTFLMVKELEGGALAVGLCNRGAEPISITAKWSELGITGRQAVRDLWRRKDEGIFENEFSSVVPRHGVAMVRLSRTAKRN